MSFQSISKGHCNDGVGVVVLAEVDVGGAILVSSCSLVFMRTSNVSSTIALRLLCCAVEGLRRSAGVEGGVLDRALTDGLPFGKLKPTAC